MLDVGRTRNLSDAYVKYRSIDQKIFMTMREAEVLSHDLAIEILVVKRPDLPVGIANGALLPTRIVADDIGWHRTGVGTNQGSQHISKELAVDGRMIRGLVATS
jgi:hypothetical protein